MPGLRLLLFNLMTDDADPVLGFASDWIRVLAARCEYVDVLTMYRGTYLPPDNVRVFSAGREHGLSKAARLESFYRRLSRLLLTRRYDAGLAHMMPLFAVLAGPLLTARGISTTIWYTHRQRSLHLRAGLLMSRSDVSADGSSFPTRRTNCASSSMASTATSTRLLLSLLAGGARWWCRWRGWRRSSIRQPR